MNEQTIRRQSESAYNQWSKQWRDQAKTNSEFCGTTLKAFENIGIGKAVVCVANGYSFEENIETLRDMQHNVDILCCDKTLGHLLDNGIVPTYCMVCDANVNYERYMEKYKDRLQDTILFMNVCANPKWAQNGNWKNKFFFVNQDIINSHLEFSRISGCMNFMPAGTNVSNAMVILLTQSDNTGRRNYFGYDKIILIGFDYLWKADGKYYAFDEDGGGKAMYMKHTYLTAPSGAFCYTSGNLIFSKDWLHKYIGSFNLPVVQCGKDSLLHLGKVSDLKEQMSYSHKREDRLEVQKALSELNQLQMRIHSVQNKVNKIGKDHWWAHARTV